MLEDRPDGVGRRVVGRRKSGDVGSRTELVFFLKGSPSRRDGAAVRASFCGLGVVLEEEAGSRQKEHEVGGWGCCVF